MADKSKLTPVMQQYVDFKSENPDALLMFRLGDFYEAFFEGIVLFILLNWLWSKEKIRQNK